MSTLQNLCTMTAVATAFIAPVTQGHAATNQPRTLKIGQPHLQVYDFQLSAAAATFINGIVFDNPFATATVAIPAKATGLSLAASDALGAHGADRLASFAALEDGWAGDGRAMRFESLSALNAFFSEGPEFPSVPSVFLLKDGSLQVVGESASGGAVEIDFRSDGIYYYSESTDAEGLVEPTSAGYQRLASVIKGQEI